MSWVNPVVRNNCGSISVHLGQPAKTPHGTWASEPGVPTLGAGPLRVRWPDGTEETLEVVMLTHTENVSDMGHEYDVHSDVPHLMIPHHGVNLVFSFLAFVIARLQVWKED